MRVDLEGVLSSVPVEAEHDPDGVALGAAAKPDVGLGHDSGSAVIPPSAASPSRVLSTLYCFPLALRRSRMKAGTAPSSTRA